MAIVRAFKGIRPVKELASQIAALPYDVMNSEEAREMVKGNPYSFLHVDRAEIDLDPSIDVHDTKVYEKARDNLNKMISDGEYMQDETPCPVCGSLHHPHPASLSKDVLTANELEELNY